MIPFLRVRATVQGVEAAALWAVVGQETSLSEAGEDRAVHAEGQAVGTASRASPRQKARAISAEVQEVQPCSWVCAEAAAVHGAKANPASS